MRAVARLRSIRSTAGPGDFGILLGALLAAFAVQGIASPGRVGQIVITTLLAATLLISLAAADARRRVMQAGLLIAVAVITASVVAALRGDVDGAAVRIANFVLVLLAPPAVAVGVVRDLRSRRKVTVHAVFGALCFYLLVGMLFAFLFGAIDRIGPAFFANGATASVAHCIYFSFITLATVGYGDFTAQTDLGHTLAVTEGLIGQVYLVTVVAVIVSNLGRVREKIE